MKKLMNKKGFTLIEMLVVIAIIAILVAIIIPTVSSATTKAKAATDAANLRSAKATITIGLLDGSITSENEDEKCDPEKLGIPAVAKSNADDEFEATITWPEDDNTSGATVVVKYGENTIKDYSDIAGGSDASSGGSNSNNSNNSNP